jgi:hypothetical protein
MTLDEFTTDALALLAAAGQPDHDFITSMTRRKSGDEYFVGSAVQAGFTWDAKQVYAATGATAELALAAFATQLGTAYPLAAKTFATGEQQEALIRLYNHTEVKRWEKTKMLLNLDRYTQAEAEKMLADGPLSFRQELRRREAASRGMAVVGSAELVQAIAA